MNFNELSTYNLADAVKFHNRLNPGLWDADEHLRPEVQAKLLEIAADFQEFLGVSDLEVEDITISGSNAAYSYTPHSDIDLHLVVRKPESHDEVYQELFNAKKYQYNDEHDIRIRGADVELYVQDADETPVSLGEYSIMNNEWIQVPRRKRANIDQNLVRHKYEDLSERIKSALAADDADHISSLLVKIKNMRQAGLDEHGEFGPENLAFKMLRTQGLIKQLYNARAVARDRELSLKELATPRKSVRYGFSESPSGVSPETKMFLSEVDSENVVRDFIVQTAKRLNIRRMPEVNLHRDDGWSQENNSFGRFEPDSNDLHVCLVDRHLLDILRTTAHELVHCRQNELKPLPGHAGETGSKWENQANSLAGVIMRDWGDAHPEHFEAGQLEESSGYIPTAAEKNDPRFKMALSVDVRPGQTGKEANKMALQTDAQGKPALLIKSLKNALREFKEGTSMPQPSQGPGRFRDLNEPLGPETPPTMPAGTVKVDVSDVYDWYKLGQHISNMKGLGKHDFGAGPPSAILSFGDEETEHKYIKDLEATGLTTTDIDPKDPKQPAGIKRQKTDPTYNVDEEDLVESLRQEFALLEDEYLSEINMSPSSLRTLAAQTGAIAGMEFEMIVPGIDAGDDDEEQEPNYDDYDETANDIDSIVNFFYDDDYNSRATLNRLRERMESGYQDWVSESVGNAWESEGRDILREYIENNEFNRDDSLEDAYDQLGLTAEQKEAANQAGGSVTKLSDTTGNEAWQNWKKATNMVEERLDELTEEAWDEQDRTYDRAFEEYSDEQRDDFSEQDWLEAEGISYMSDVERQYEISWPHWTSADGGGAGIESVADDFASAIGRKTNWSASYHGGAREPNAYVVEPDGSLNPANSDDAGLEFVSPPLPIDDMLSDLNKVKAWADERGCYTSKAAKTGLHINVSVPNFDAKKLDYVKLALLLGDQYVLEQFGRTGNTYAKSALDIVKTRVQERPGDAALLLNKMRDNLEALATKVIHTGETSKFTSINTKTGYVEFRSPGGDWLDENFGKIENTLLRFVVALDAAMDPQKYRDEYLKKLYKLLNPAGQKDAYGDMVQEFSRYMVYLEQHSTDAPGKLSPEAQQAIKDFRRAAAAELAQTTAAPAGASANYKIYSITDGRVMDTFYAANQAAAEDQFRDWLMSPEAGASDNFRYAPIDTVIQGPGAAATTTNTLTPTGPGPWEIVRAADGQVVYRIAHYNRSAAESEARTWLQMNNADSSGYAVRTRENAGAADAARNGIIDIEPDIEQYAVPGSTLDLQRQRQQAAQQPAGTFRGTWAIKDNRGNTLHTFGGIGNAQADANRVAAGWLAQQGYQAGLEVEVVPVMEP